MQVIPFYEYYEGLQEGWDGPALLVFSDGNKVGARLDRNGLRPARYWETNDDMVYVASEVWPLPPACHQKSYVMLSLEATPVSLGLQTFYIDTDVSSILAIFF